jgi:hypothetical protein
MLSALDEHALDELALSPVKTSCTHASSDRRRRSPPPHPPPRRLQLPSFAMAQKLCSARCFHEPSHFRVPIPLPRSILAHYPRPLCTCLAPQGFFRVWLLVPIRPKVARCVMKFQLEGIGGGDSRTPVPRTLAFFSQTCSVLTDLCGGRTIVVCTLPCVLSSSTSVLVLRVAGGVVAVAVGVLALA